jgi:hypothetical protein
MSKDLLADYISRQHNVSVAPKDHLTLDSTAVELTGTVLTFIRCVLHYYGVARIQHHYQGKVWLKDLLY